MALSRLSLDRVIVWIGVTALAVLFVPAGVFLSRNAFLSAEDRLLERGRGLAATVKRQVVELLLVGERLAVYEVLCKAAQEDADVRYLCVADATGAVVVHTFSDGYPLGLAEFWQRSGGEATRFRGGGEPLIDIPVPILGGRVGAVHVGLSRAGAVAAGDAMLWQMGAALAAATAVVLAGSRLIATMVSRPLRQLEAEVSRLPQAAASRNLLRLSGTSEVVSLAKGVMDMAARLQSLEHERGLTQQKMVQAERLAALGEVAAGLAHEIHNPLDGMLECVRYLDADPEKSSRAAKYYPMLRDGLERIARVMRQMLTFARSGQQVSVEPRSVVEMLEKLASLVTPRLQGRNVRLAWDCTGNCQCLCVPHDFVQAGLNLILNAAEAVEEVADPRIRVEAACDSQWVHVVVEDNGPGVPEGLQGRIFDPFFTTKPVGKGTGLGLSVSRQLLRAAGGDVQLSPGPSPLGGARFVIRLPKVRSPEVQKANGASENSGR